MNTKNSVERNVYCEDAITWLTNSEQIADNSFVASLPDISEFSGSSLEGWKSWFIETAKLIMTRTSDEGVSVFYQSDIKYEGTWVDKGYLCQKAAEELGHSLIWHKIICRIAPGKISFGRPAYSHILCFSKNFRLQNLEKSTPDVIPVMGKKTWERGMGLEACLLIAKFIKEETRTKTLIQPFCGEGSMLAAAESVGLNVIGIERSHKRAELARKLQLNPTQKDFLK